MSEAKTTTTLKLPERDLNVLRLILRSPDRGDGWRSVSAVCWPFIRDFEHGELIEGVQNDDGSGVVRLSERGAILGAYI